MEKSKNTEFEILKEAVEKEYRTDHLTLPNVPNFQDEEADKISDMERAIILNPAADNSTVVDKDGTTLGEYKERLQKGVMPKNAPKAAKDSIGKHTFETEVVDGITQVIVIAPEAPEAAVEVAPVVPVEVPKSTFSSESPKKDFEIKESGK